MNDFNKLIMEGNGQSQNKESKQNDIKELTPHSKFPFQESESNREREQVSSQNIIPHPQFKSQSSFSAKKVDEKKGLMKKLKINIQDFSEYLPQFLILVNHHKSKSIIRMGKNYQATVPRSCEFSQIYRPLNSLKLWSTGEFNYDVFKKFKEKFGESRTEEELCLQLYQYQCDWDEIWIYLKNNQDLRKYYLQKDRSKF